MAGITYRSAMEMLVEGPGLVLVSGRFRIDGTNNPDRTVDGVPNTKQTVVTWNDTTKIFTVTLPKMGGGWPAEMISCMADVAYIDAADAGVDELNVVRYVVDSYNRATGAFQLAVVSHTGATVAAIGNLNDNSEVSFIATLRRSKALAQTL